MANVLQYALYPSIEWKDVLAEEDVDQQSQQLADYLKSALKDNEIVVDQVKVQHHPEHFGYDYNAIEGWELWNRFDIVISGFDDAEQVNNVLNMLPYLSKVIKL